MTETEFRLMRYREAKQNLISSLKNKSPNSVAREAARSFLIACSNLGAAEARAENRRMLKAKTRREEIKYSTESNIGCEE